MGMNVVGLIESLWRYPVKSMRGEELREAFLGFGGVYGDRRYAFLSSAARDDFPYLTAREKHEMLLHRPIYRHPELMMKPSPRLTRAYASLDVETPTGERLPVEDPRLIDLLREGLRERLGDRPDLAMVQSDVAITDNRPVSLFSLQTVRRIGEEVGTVLDKRRFRANIYVDLAVGDGFGEDEWVGRKLVVGSEVIVEILKRNKRCKMVTLDPDTSDPNPEVVKKLAEDHDTRAGIYAAVLVEGTVGVGDEICLVD